jgi:hypothetical protein
METKSNEELRRIKDQSEEYIKELWQDSGGEITSHSIRVQTILWMIKWFTCSTHWSFMDILKGKNF